MQKLRKSPTRLVGKGAGKGGTPRQVRIIGGLWKRTPLAVPDAEGLRPTPDRVRETVFNWLNHLLDGEWESVACLDLFAGTGALGFEAASRGSPDVLMIDENPAALRQLEATKERLQARQVRIKRADALSAIADLTAAYAGNTPPFRLIFLDPPYHQDWLARALPLCEPLLADGGLVYVEAESVLDPESGVEWLQGWAVLRAARAGTVFYHLLQRKK